jgi:hypothetical protein
MREYKIILYITEIYDEILMDIFTVVLVLVIMTIVTSTVTGMI